jgi:hypothetical protein
MGSLFNQPTQESTNTVFSTNTYYSTGDNSLFHIDQQTIEKNFTSIASEIEILLENVANFGNVDDQNDADNLNTYFKDYSTKLSNLIVQIQEMQSPFESSYLDKEKALFLNILDAIKYSFNMYYQNERNQSKIDQLEEKVELLNDPVYLKNRYNELISKRNISLFDIDKIDIGVNPILKPEYEIYKKLYGAPANHIYRTELLQSILADMK